MPRTRSRSGNSSKDQSSTRKQPAELDDYSIIDPAEIDDGPDVLVDVPGLKVDSIDIEVDDLRAQVAVTAEVGDLVQLGVGADVRLGKVELEIEGVEAQALLKARLANVSRIIGRALTTLDRNPELLESVSRTAEEVGSGTGKLLGQTGEAVADVGQGADQALGQIGKGAGEGVAGVGEGLRQGGAR
ncbi:MAG TPA: hypothetical protein VHR38_13990 [Solirubrobacterales bacterium]|jgi:hypothetical protein|nr:hypothetical protein [Solirubrobacterales bacterium]